MPRKPKAEPKPSRSLAAVAAAGDRAETLRTLRDQLAEAFEMAGTREKATLASQLRAVLVELEQLPTASRSAVDELGAVRAKRRAAAKGRASAGRGGGDVGSGSG